MMNAMNKVLRDCIPDITMPFLDDIPIKGCPESEKDGSFDQDGCRGFVSNHIEDCERVLKRLEGAWITFFGEKSGFGQREILVVRHLCGPDEPKPSLEKVNCYSLNARGMWNVDRSLKILRRMCVLPYLDSALCSCGRTLV